MMRVVLLFLRRLWLPLVFFLGFSLMGVLVYQHLEGLRWQDALFWIINPHAIEYRRVRDATKFFSIFVYFGVFAFQIWVAERLLITVFNRQSMEAWRTMVNDMMGERRHHFHGELPVIQSLSMDYLLKTEPSEYSFADLERDQSTVWDGVSNPVALKNLRAMKPGDRLVIYETGDHKSAVGTATVVSVEISDARNPQVKIKAGKALGSAVTLAEVKANKLFADSPLVRQGRLSVVPLTEKQYGFLAGR